MSNAYKFQANASGFDVYYRGKSIGQIISTKESSGRHCFSLGFDRRKYPRTYRGKVHAAEALHEIYKLAKEFRNRRWSVEQLIVLSWDQRPRASRDFQCSK